MVNPVKGEVAFTVEGGATYTVQFTIDAICTLENLLDKSIGQIAGQIATGRIGTIRAALWAGLRQHHPKLTIFEAGELMPVIEGRKAVEIVGEALEKAFGKSEAASEGPADPQTAPEADGTGKAS